MEESAIEPLNEEDARMVEDQAGEENALKTKRQPRRPSEQEIAAHEAGGHYPYRDWCRACVGGAGRCDAHRRDSDEQTEIPNEERLSETQATEILKAEFKNELGQHFIVKTNETIALRAEIQDEQLQTEDQNS